MSEYKLGKRYRSPASDHLPSSFTEFRIYPAKVSACEDVIVSVQTSLVHLRSHKGAASLQERLKLLTGSLNSSLMSNPSDITKFMSPFDCEDGVTSDDMDNIP